MLVCVSEVMWIAICWVQSLDTTGGRRGRGTARSSGNIYIGTHHALEVSTKFAEHGIRIRRLLLILVRSFSLTVLIFWTRWR